MVVTHGCGCIVMHRCNFEIWNLEFELISSIIKLHNMISMETEFSWHCCSLYTWSHVIRTPDQFRWEFNFRNFYVTRDPHVPESIELLRGQDIDFEKNCKNEIDRVHFAELMKFSGLLFNDVVC
ncbi:hypothetical protein VNO77_15871 [Canavalia gladiata]|uniref:Uncharacterized protein n=1 Tax=Canavalia gladiata TaxID=3824 RepID=A0AAN9QW27_CANGL